MTKVGKTTTPFRYHLNQIPYDYIVEMMNRFKGLDLGDKVSEELWKEVHNIHCTGGGDQNHPKEQEMRESKIVV